jgi:hypothetical protein
LLQDRILRVVDPDGAPLIVRHDLKKFQRPRRGVEQGEGEVDMPCRFGKNCQTGTRDENKADTDRKRPVCGNGGGRIIGAGVTTSKGPIPFGIGGSFSTPDMFSEGVGPIGMRPGKSSLKLSDFGGSGLIFSMAAGFGKGVGLTIVLFGIPPFTVATGRMRSIQFIAPGAGFTAMPCFFTIDP